MNKNEKEREIENMILEEKKVKTNKLNKRKKIKKIASKSEEKKQKKYILKRLN